MIRRSSRSQTAGLLSFCAVLAACPLSYAADTPTAPLPDAAWDAPSTYYSGVSDSGGNALVGAALRARLNTIVSTGAASVSYDAEKLTMPITDRLFGTTASQKQMWGCYDRKVLTGVWDGAATWNREHVWPQSKLGGNSDHDMFGLRPAYVQSNGDRANYGYGGYNITDTTTAAGNLPKASGATSPLFYAGAYDRGDTARACFYMATRYYSASNPTAASSLKIVNTEDGNNPDGTLGDLKSMLRANYLDPVDNFERRRNQYIYSNPELADSGSNKYSQRNRNPYVDHPEYVWAVFGDGANDSQITVNTPTAGASSRAVSFGRVIVGGTAPTLSTAVDVSKSGVDPTTFSVTTSGAATTNLGGNLNTFDYGAGKKTVTVGLAGVNTASAGVKSGTVKIDNTDLTNAGSGTGALDGDDTIDLSLNVLDHSNASFETDGNTDTLIINFDTVQRGTTASRTFSLSNLLAASGYTAGLDLDTITGVGDTAAFNTGVSTFAALAGGSTRDFVATFTPPSQGGFYAAYTIGVSDEDLSGATTGDALTLILSGLSASRTVPEPAVLAFLPLAGLLLRRRTA